MSFCHGKLRLTALLVAAAFFVLGLAAARPAAAAALKADIVVEGEQVVLGDLFADAGEAGHAVVAKAPEPGERLQIAAWSVQRFAAANGIAWDNALHLETIEVRRASAVFTAADIVARLKDLIAAETGAAQIEVGLNQSRLTIHMPVGATQGPQISLISLDRTSGRYEARIDAGGGRTYQVSGQAIEMIDVPVLARAIDRGAIIADADLAWMSLRIDRIGAAVVTNPDDLVGLASKRPLRAGAPIGASDLEKPIAIRKGALVAMTYQVPGMVLSDMGRALDQGSVGDTIAILNPRSHRTVYGRVSGTDTVVLDGGGRAGLRQEAALHR